MSAMDTMSDLDLEGVADAIGVMTEAVEKAGLSVDAHTASVLLNFVRVVWPQEPIDLLTQKTRGVAEAGPVVQVGPGGDFVSVWPQGRRVES